MVQGGTTQPNRGTLLSTSPSAHRRRPALPACPRLPLLLLAARLPLLLRRRWLPQPPPPPCTGRLPGVLLRPRSIRLRMRPSRPSSSSSLYPLLSSAAGQAAKAAGRQVCSEAKCDGVEGGGCAVGNAGGMAKGCLWKAWQYGGNALPCRFPSCCQPMACAAGCPAPPLPASPERSHSCSPAAASSALNRAEGACSKPPPAGAAQLPAAIDCTS